MALTVDIFNISWTLSLTLWVTIRSAKAQMKTLIVLEVYKHFCLAVFKQKLPWPFVPNTNLKVKKDLSLVFFFGERLFNYIDWMLYVLKKNIWEIHFVRNQNFKVFGLDSNLWMSQIKLALQSWWISMRSN